MKEGKVEEGEQMEEPRDEVVSAEQPAEPGDRQVSVRQRLAIQLLLEGRPDAEIADWVGVRVAQLRAWKQHSRFRRALAEASPVQELYLLVAAVEVWRLSRRYPRRGTPWTS